MEKFKPTRGFITGKIVRMSTPWVAKSDHWSVWVGIEGHRDIVAFKMGPGAWRDMWPASENQMGTLHWVTQKGMDGTVYKRVEALNVKDAEGWRYPGDVKRGAYR